jgi:predicted nucleotidyltransferase component of viral defense system
MANTRIDYHRDADLFRAALGFTAAQTGFSERLIEKDYYCSVALADLCAADDTEIVFKGGTCLSKVHADFFRLSEDLDFSLSTPTDASRSQRSRRLDGFKRYFAAISQRCESFQIDQPLRGFNSSLQYGARLAYRSVISGQDDYLKVEVSVREPVVEPHATLPARTVLLDPFRKAAAVEPFAARVLTAREAYAEKLRAALSRRDPAIRDFFDLDHAFAAGNVSASDVTLIQLLRDKLAIPANEPVDVSAAKLAQLRAQVDTDLRPVIREADFRSFDLDRAFQRVVGIVAMLGG